MNYKIPKNILLISIIICFVLTIYTTQQIRTIKNKNDMITLQNNITTALATLSVGITIESLIAKDEFHLNYNKKN
ncbi:MAG: hypothetical protein AB4372_39005 [Xenococcus sp. (in: cyanobacteria)]